MKKIKKTKKIDYLQEKLNYKKQSLMTFQEAYDYYVKKHPVLLIWIIVILIVTALTAAFWDGSIPVSHGIMKIK
ncbi:MAG: hypothetical protein LBE12_02895 [Planctomycetaceae bacterium]|jgi:hypothetical protein|nr:hypothetical protein [Planctomycetaceae bacterium]